MFESRSDPSSLLEVIESTHREESILVARRLAAVAALLRHRVAVAERPDREYAQIAAFEQTAAEVAAAMNLSPMGASYLVSYAEALDVRLPKIAALLAKGRTDWRTVRLIISRTELVTDETLIAKLDHSLAERIGDWHGWSRQRIVNAIDAAVRTADPDAARERRLSAEGERCIGITAAADGMAEVHGSVAASAAAASVLAASPVTSPVEALRYQPSAALERAVRCRDLTCRFPGCSRPAVVCDLDHTVPFNHQHPAAGGPTTAENLKCLCRQHHRLKTFGGWHDKQLPDGTVNRAGYPSLQGPV